ncbi:MAG TPA: hypothetical protein VIY48_13250 [Candidatus Paceibacterota bacterium]
MAAATATATVTKAFKAGRVIRAYGTVAITASPDTYTTGGITLSFAGKIPGTQRAPLNVDFNGVSGFNYSYVKGTNISDGKIMIRVNDAGGVNAPEGEHTAVAIVAGVSGDTITFSADFDALI